MVTPPLPLRSPIPCPPAWQRWALNVIYSFDRCAIDDWASLLAERLERPDDATAMRTAQYTVDVINHVGSLGSATATLAAHGNQAARSLLADAALDLNSALDRLYAAKDELLKSARAEQLRYDD